MNDVPAPSAQVIVPNAHWTFLLEWKPDYRALTYHTVHSLSNSMLLCLGFPHYLVKGNIYLRQFLQVSEVSSFCRISPSFPPPRSQSSVLLGSWERVCVVTWFFWHQGPVVNGTWEKKVALAPWTLPLGFEVFEGDLLVSTNHPVQCYYLPWYLPLFLDKPAHVPCSLTTRSWRA